MHSILRHRIRTLLLAGTALIALIGLTAPPAAAASWSDYSVPANGMISIQPSYRQLYIVSPNCSPRLIVKQSNGTTDILPLNTDMSYYPTLGLSACISVNDVSEATAREATFLWWTSAGDIPATVVQPLQVTNVRSTPGNKVINLTWDAPEHAQWVDHYDFYAWQTSTPSGLYGKVGIKTATSYQFRVPNNGDDWVVRIIPVNIFGQGIRTDVPASANITPKPVARVSVYPGDRQLRAIFDPTTPDDAVISSYVLTVTPGNTQITVGANQRDVTITSGITNNTAYQVSVAAVNQAGTGQVVDSNLATPRATPSPVRDVQVRATGARGATVSWQAATGDVTKYIVTTTTGLRTEVPASHTSANFTDLLSTTTAGSRVGFSVITVNDYLVSAATTTDSTLTPEAPANVSLSGGLHSVTATWSNPSALATPVLGYDIELVGPNNQVVTRATALGSESDITFANLESGQRLRARVSLRTAWGTSPASLLSASAVVEDVPEKPQSVTASQVKSSVPTALVTLGNVNARGCAVTTWSVTSTWIDADGTVHENTTSASAQTASQIITGFPFGTDVTFSTTATNCWGESSAASTTLRVVEPPHPVTDAASSINALGQVVVTWTPSDTSSVTSQIVTLLPTGKSVTVSNSTRRVVFADTTLGQTYSATVTARNSFGTSLSATTNTVTSMVLPDPVGNLSATIDEANASASVEWSEPNYSGSAITSYTVTVDDQLPVVTTDAFVTVTGLLAGEQHSVSVLATNELGNGPLSTITFGIAPAPIIDPDVNGTVIVWDLAANVRQSSLLNIQQRTANSTWKTIATVRASTKKLVIKKAKKTSQFRVVAKAKGKTIILKSRKVK